jgi:hypothetical protein
MTIRMVVLNNNTLSKTSVVCLSILPYNVLSFCISVCLHVRPTSILSAHISVCPFVRLSIRRSASLAVCMSSLCPSVDPSVCLSVCLSVSPLSLCWSVGLSVCPFHFIPSRNILWKTIPAPKPRPCFSWLGSKPVIFFYNNFTARNLQLLTGLEKFFAFIHFRAGRVKGSASKPSGVKVKSFFFVTQPSEQ